MSCCDGKQDRWVPSWCGFIDYVPTVPQLYWNVNSNEQRYHVLCKELHKLICYADMLGDSLEITHEQVDQLEREFEEFKESGFLDYYEQQLEAWINANMPEIIGKYVRMVFFGLTLDGHFVAYIPDGTGWDDIIFDTGAVYRSDEYGRLILLMDVDNASDVLPDYENEHTEMGILQRLLNDLEERVENLEG